MRLLNKCVKTARNALRKACLLIVALAALRVESAPTTEITFLYQGPKASHALLGALQGLEEANLQGRFLGYKFTLIESPNGPERHAFKNAVALFVAEDSAAISALSSRYKSRPVFNLIADNDELRAACLPNVFHIPPSSQMKRAAEAQWLNAHPDAPATAHAWHALFEKYSGIQLNNRFQKMHKQLMDDDAWAGWAAVKMAADSIIRSQTSLPSATLVNFLRKQLTFDGQKGIDMNFRADGQLRQVLLLVANNAVVGEAPVRGVADPQDLDSLGKSVDCQRSKRK